MNQTPDNQQTDNQAIKQELDKQNALIARQLTAALLARVNNGTIHKGQTKDSPEVIDLQNSIANWLSNLPTPRETKTISQIAELAQAITDAAQDLTHIINRSDCQNRQSEKTTAADVPKS